MWLAIFCKLSDEFSIVDFSRKFNKNVSKNHPGGSPETPRTMPERFLTHSANSLRILSPKSANRALEISSLLTPLGPAGDPKMLKNRAGEIFEASREGPGAVPNRIFDRRGCETRSNSIFGRFLDPSDPYETLRMAANLKVFRFAHRGSKKTQNRGPGDPIFELFRLFIFFFSALPGGQKSQIGDFCDFRARFFARKFAMRKKTRKKTKRCAGRRNARCRREGGEGCISTQNPPGFCRSLCGSLHAGFC